MNRRNFLKAVTGSAVGACVLAVAPNPLVYSRVPRGMPFSFSEGTFFIGDVLTINGKNYTVTKLLDPFTIPKSAQHTP